MGSDRMQGLMTARQNGDGETVVDFHTWPIKGGGGGASKREPFDITFSVAGAAARATVRDMIFQVGNRLMETEVSLPEVENPNNYVDIPASGYLWAKIDTSVDPYQVEELVTGTGLSDFVDATESGKYHFKALYKLTKTGTKLAVALDLRKTQVPQLT